MNSFTSIIQSKWYHFSMSAIYIIGGCIVILKSVFANSDVKPIVLGSILCCYGIFRLVSRLLSSKASEKIE